VGLTLLTAAVFAIVRVPSALAQRRALDGFVLIAEADEIASAAEPISAHGPFVHIDVRGTAARWAQW